MSELPKRIEEIKALDLIVTPYVAQCIDCEKKFPFRIVFLMKHEEVQELIGKTIFSICDDCYPKFKEQIGEIAKAMGFFFVNYPEKKDGG